MTKLKTKLKKKHLPLAVACFSFLIPIATFFLLYFGKIYPGVYAVGINLSGKTPEEAIKLLAQTTPPKEINLTTKEGQSFKIPTDSFDLKYNYNATATEAFGFGRTGNPVFDTEQVLKSFLFGTDIGAVLSLDEEKLADIIFAIAGQVGTDPVYPGAAIVNDILAIEKGQKGTELNANNLRLLIGKNLYRALDTPIEIPTEEIDPSLNTFELASFTKRAKDLSPKKLELSFEFQKIEVKGNDILILLNGKGGYNNDKLNKLTEEVATEINRAPQEAKFVFDPGQKRVNAFEPSKTGVSVNKTELTQKIIDTLTKDEAADVKLLTFEIPVTTTPPKLKTGDVNSLGIRELIGRGTSTFYGSIPSRVFNISLAAKRISGTLVAPGDTFSFNDTVGDISELSGYKKAYIIQDGKTILGDGGGVCQVSTTLFRAVMSAGLPIVSRTAHAYRVYYYEQDAPPGMDATVYSPTVDFKFKNDTANYILIQAYPDTRNYSLVFEIYGTRDGRTSEVGRPVILSTTPPPPDVYQDDPTLPAGTIKQTEHRALGTNLYFIYKVTKNGETTFQRTFYSNYRPWGNVFLRGVAI